MKYIAILNESDLESFEKFNPRPIIREMLVLPSGESAYLSKEHIECLEEFEQKRIFREVTDKIANEIIDDIIKGAIKKPDEYAKELFDGKCPYTSKKCESFNCTECKVEEEERRFLNDG